MSDPTALIAAVIEYGRLSDFSSRDIAEDVMAAIREGRRPRASSPTSPPPVPDLAATIDADTDNGWTPPSSPVRPHAGTGEAQEDAGQGESGTGARMSAQRCCDACAGTGFADDPDTYGRCSDCYGTGHVHPADQTPEGDDRG